MTRTQRALAVCAFFAGMLVVPCVAECKPKRVVCRGVNANVLRNARKAGVKLVRQAWRGLGEDPDRVDELSTRVVRRMRERLQGAWRGGDKRPRMKCRAKGLRNAALGELERIQAEVAGACFLDGEFVGDFNAQLYCALSEVVGGLAEGLDFELPEPQTAICGGSFEQACQQTFAERARNDAACAEYTEPPHETVFEENQLSLCVYVF